MLALAAVFFLLHKKRRRAAVFLLLAAAAAALAYGFWRTRVQAVPDTEHAAPTYAAVPTPTPSPTLAPTPTVIPTPTVMPASTPPAPERDSWVLSFAGDCTIGPLHEWQGASARHNMLYVMDGDYTYPLSDVAALFGDDDFTMVNLEGTFTACTDAVSKPYRFRAPPEAAQVLTEGNVEAVTLANNHTGDYRDQGLADTRTALEAVGVLYADETAPLITELPDGPKLGILAFNCVEIDLAVGDVNGYMQRVTPLYDQCVQADCDLILAYVHWGWEYRTAPELWMEEFAHALADLGCDMVIGSHPHVLQKAERYQGVPIFYSLGNFCYGGHSAP